MNVFVFFDEIFSLNMASPLFIQFKKDESIIFNSVFFSF